MAFGSRTQVARADVVFESNLGVFRSEMTEAQRVYDRTTGAMSTDALRLAAAQEKVNRAVDRYGPESLQAKQATVNLRQEMDRLATSAGRADRSIDGIDARTSRASAAFGRLRGSVALASAGLLGSTGLLFALRSVVGAAKEAETAEGRLAVAVRNAGVDFAKHRQQIDETIQAHSRMSAFDDEDLSDSFARLIIRTKSVSEALRLNALAANVARGRQISLEAATQLVIKASLGQAGQLKRVGIEVGKNATATQLLTQLTEAYAGHAARFAASAQGAQDRLNVSFEESQEIIGRALLPTIGDLAGKIADYLDKANRTGQLQREVNAAMEAAGKIVKGLADGLELVKTVGEPVVDMLGGLENAAQLALIVGIAGKARKAAASFGLIGAASAVTRTKVVADAAAMGAALDAATRPRVVPVTVTGSGGAAAPTTGKGRIPWAIGFNIPTIVAGAVITSAGATARTGAYDPKKYPRVAALLARIEAGQALTANERAALGEFGNRSISQLKPDELARLNANLAPQAAGAEGGDRDRPNQGRPVPSGATAPGGGGASAPSQPTDTDFALKLARAYGSRGTGDELALLRGRVTYVSGQIARLEAEKSLTEGQKQRLLRLYGERDRRQDEIDRIEDAAAAKQTAREKARAAKRAKEAADAAARRKRDAETVAGILSPGPYATIGRPNEFSPAGQSPTSLTKSSSMNGAGRGLSAADVSRQIHDFLTRFDEIQSRYGGTNRAPVVVNQTFPAPTPDRMMEARFARFAMEAALSG